MSHNIIEFNSLGVSREVFNKFCDVFNIWREWAKFYKYEDPNTTYLRGCDELFFLKVYCEQEELVKKITSFNRLKAFI